MARGCTTFSPCYKATITKLRWRCFRAAPRHVERAGYTNSMSDHRQSTESVTSTNRECKDERPLPKKARKHHCGSLLLARLAGQHQCNSANFQLPLELASHLEAWKSAILVTTRRRNSTPGKTQYRNRYSFNANTPTARRRSPTKLIAFATKRHSR